MENNSSFEKEISKMELPFWKENLEREKKRLKRLFEFSHGVEHSATMDCKRNIKKYENKINELEENNMGLCDECGQEFPLKKLTECKLNGEDMINKICKECCKKCGYYTDGECGF